MKTPQKVPHADLIDDFDFRQWCDNNPTYQYCSVDKWRHAYIVYVQQARTAKEAAKILNVCIDHVYCLVRQYESAAKEYKAARANSSDLSRPVSQL
jgi:hypothetical protein